MVSHSIGSTTTIILVGHVDRIGQSHESLHDIERCLVERLSLFLSLRVFFEVLIRFSLGNDHVSLFGSSHFHIDSQRDSIGSVDVIKAFIFHVKDRRSIQNDGAFLIKVTTAHIIVIHLKRFHHHGQWELIA